MNNEEKISEFTPQVIYRFRRDYDTKQPIKIGRKTERSLCFSQRRQGEERWRAGSREEEALRWGMIGRRYRPGRRRSEMDREGWKVGEENGDDRWDWLR